MPIHGYFTKRDDRKLTMPRADEGFPNEVGISYWGGVLNGLSSVQDAFAFEAAQLRAHNRNKWVAPKDYDPVLKAHLGIK